MSLDNSPYDENVEMSLELKHDDTDKLCERCECVRVNMLSVGNCLYGCNSCLIGCYVV